MGVPVTAALAAAKAGTLGAGFSGAGFLIPFFLGVIQVLYNDLKVLSFDMPVAGASSGAIVAMAANGVVNVTRVRAEVDRLSAYCRAHSNCYGNLQEEVTKAARAMAPSDAAERTNRHGRTYIAISYPSPAGAAQAAGKMVSRFASNEDQIQAVASSIYIPLWAGPRLATSFRGDQVYDGSLSPTDFLPCPPNVTYCVRVSSMPAGASYGRFLVNSVLLGSRADKGRIAEVAAATLLGANAAPQLANSLAALAGRGKASGAAEAGQLAQLVLALTRMVAPGEGEADIWPGRRHPLPFRESAWLTSMLRPQDPAGVEATYDLGRAEALSWAQEAGFPAAKVVKSIKDLKRP